MDDFIIHHPGTFCLHGAYGIADIFHVITNGQVMKQLCDFVVGGPLSLAITLSDLVIIDLTEVEI